jgi:hypothetical protein
MMEGSTARDHKKPSAGLWSHLTANGADPDAVSRR